MVRQPNGRWESEWRLWELPELFRQVAVALRPDDPLNLGAREFDRGRVAAGWPDAPTAGAIRRRLGSPPWDHFVAVCLRRERDFYDVARWLDPWQRDRYTARDAAEALRFIARLRNQGTLRVGEYAEARLEVLDRRGSGRVPLPTAWQVAYQSGDRWDEALRAAGLEVSAVERDRGLSVPEALDACISAHGTRPTKRELRQFVQANQLLMMDGTQVRLGAAESQELERRRAARGLSTPESPPLKGDRPDYGRPVEPGAIPKALRRPSRVRHLAETAQPGMHAFLEQLDSRLMPIWPLYVEHLRGDPGAASTETLQRFGGFAVVRDQALDERVRRRRQ